MLRTARSALPKSFVRPLGVSVRAYKDDAKKEHKEADVPVHKEDKQVQKHEGSGSGMMHVDPYMRFGRLPNMFQELQREMDALRRGFGLWDDDLFMQPFRSSLFDMEPFQKPLAAAVEAMPTMRLATDIEETDKEYIIKADVPGMSRDNIKLQLLENMLTISGERKEETKQEGKDGAKPALYERKYGKFVRSFALPNNVNAEGITASCKDGVLSVVVPKMEEQVPTAKEIAIE